MFIVTCNPFNHRSRCSWLLTSPAITRMIRGSVDPQFSKKKKNNDGRIGSQGKPIWSALPVGSSTSLPPVVNRGEGIGHWALIYPWRGCFDS